MNHTTASGGEVAKEEDLEQLANNVDLAMAEVQGMPPEFRNQALALKSAIEEFHRVGLTHIVRTLKGDSRGKELLFELVDVQAVYALFSMHGLVRADLRTQVGRVLEMVRPYLQSHGGDVALADVRDKVVYVRLIGNCTGCSMSQVTLKNTVEETLKEHLPEIERVQVVEEPAVVQISKTGGLRNDQEGWIEGPLASQVIASEPYVFVDGDIQILILSTSQGLRAYRNSCAHQGLPLDSGLVDGEAGTITCPWHGFSFDMESGECFTAPQCQLEAFPLRIDDGRVWIRPNR